MYIIDLTHCLDAKGSIAAERGPARKMADFVTAVVAHATNVDRCDQDPGPACFKCRKRDDCRVDCRVSEDSSIAWRCRACGTEGRISNWQGSFWDLGHAGQSH